MIIFDCNGVLVDSEPIAAAVAAEEFTRAGIPLTPELVLRFFFGRRPADMIAMVEAAAKCKLPPSFAGRRVFDHDTVARLNPHPRCDMEEEVRRGLPVGNVGCGKHVIEEPGKPCRRETCANAIERC